MNLQSYENRDEGELIFLQNIIEDQGKKLYEFKPDIELDEISATLQLNEKSYTRVNYNYSNCLVLGNITHQLHCRSRLFKA